MNERERLPNRRASVRFNFWHGNFEYSAGVGFYPDWRIGEVFLTAGKAGTELDIATRDSAIALSFALQHGCAPETIQAAMTRNNEGKPEGALGVLVDKLVELQREVQEELENGKVGESENPSECDQPNQDPC